MDLTAAQLTVTQLTVTQRTAVAHDGPSAVLLGGAGTGKTTTLVARYLRLAEAMRPSRVLVVCRDRNAARRFTDAVLPHLRGGVDAVPITTVYGLAHDVMARSGPPLRFLSGAEQRVRVEGLLAAEQKADWPTLGHLLGRPAFPDEVLAALGDVEAVGWEVAEAAPDPWPELVRFARRYRAVLDDRGELDAGSLLARAAARAAEACDGSRFEHVMVDDAEALPAVGVTLVARIGAQAAGVTVAGNDDAGVVPAALAPSPAVACRLSERFRVAPPGTLVRCGHPSTEPEAVAGELLAAHTGGVAWSHMAVVVRHLGSRARAIARALARHGIPVIPVPALASEEPVVRAVLDLLRWVDGDPGGLDRLLVSPLAALDPLTVRAVRREAGGDSRVLEDDPRVAHLVALRNRLIGRLAAGDSPADLAYEAWAGGLSSLTGNGGGSGLGAVDDRALDGLVALIDGLAHHAADSPGAGLTATLAAIDAGGLTPDPWRQSASAGWEGVTITSVGAAAGQEWHSVVVAGCVEGELPRVRLRARLFDPALLTEEPLPAEAPRRQTLDDERRLFALATSRATRRLVATAAPQPGVLLSRFVEAWPVSAAKLPLAPGQAPPVRAVTAGAGPVSPEGRLRLSATQLSTYDDCPLRYAYEYVLGARDDTGVHAGLGSLVHQVLATFLNPEQPLPRTFDSLMAVANEVWRDDVARYRPQVEEARRDFVAMLTAWWEQEGSREELAPEVLAVERKFDFDVGPHRLVGYIDRIDRADDGVGTRVVDYKTGKKEPSAADVAADLQLAVYHLAASRDPGLAELGTPTQLQLRYLRKMRTYDQPVTDGHAVATEERVLATAERILAEDFAPAVDATCRTCSFHRLCPLQPPGRQVDQP